jgi:hypothetical protein
MRIVHAPVAKNVITSEIFTLRYGTLATKRASTEGRLCSVSALRVARGRCVFMPSWMLSTQRGIGVASLLTQATPIIPQVFLSSTR